MSPMFWALMASTQQVGASRAKKVLLGRALRRAGRRMRARVGTMVVFILVGFLGGDVE